MLRGPRQHLLARFGQFSEAERYADLAAIAAITAFLGVYFAAVWWATRSSDSVAGKRMGARGAPGSEESRSIDRRE